MPNFFDPTEKTEIVFALDAKRPLEQQRKIVCRFITMRQRRQIDSLLSQARDSKDPAEQDKLVSDALAVGIVTPVDELEGMFSEAELWLLAAGYANWIFASEVDLKKSPSPAASGPATSASNAPPAVA